MHVELFNEEEECLKGLERVGWQHAKSEKLESIPKKRLKYNMDILILVLSITYIACDCDINWFAAHFTDIMINQVNSKQFRH